MTLIYGVIYFLPWIAGWVMAKITGEELPLRRLFLMNLLTGWTGIGWFVCWAYLIVKHLTITGAAGAASSGGTYAPPTTTSQTPAYGPSERQPCGSCGGSGRTRCWSCGGQGGQWRQPVTATDTASWVACGSCTASGSVTCTSCNGSGYGW